MAHEDLKKLYELDAKETDKPWERWEFLSRVYKEWDGLDGAPVWFNDYQYRRKPGLPLPQGADDGPDSFDGCSKDGFVGGCERMGCCEHAKSAPDFLRRAAELMEERGKQYDKPDGERSMGKCVSAFNAITGRDLSESEGWLLMAVLKQVRLFQKAGFHQDSAEDAIAYAALLAEAKQAECA